MGGERESTIRENDSDREGARPKRRVGAAEGVTLAPEGEPLAKAAGPTISVPLAATFVSLARTVLAALDPVLAGTGPPGIGGQTVRTHESGGNIHFHVDAEGLKAEVPVADWWSAWRRLQNLGKFTWLDSKNRTLLTVVTWIDDDGLGGDIVRLTITVRVCNPAFSVAFEQMDRTTGR